MQNVLGIPKSLLPALFQVGRSMLMRECYGLDLASETTAVSADVLSSIADNRDRFADFDCHQVMARNDRT